MRDECGSNTQELSKAERAALFKQQNQAKIDAQKAAKEKEKLSKAERAAQQEAQRAAKAAAQGKDGPAAPGAAAPATPASSGGSGPGGGGKVGGSLQHDDSKAMEKAKKGAAMQRTEVVSSKKVPWFQHLPQYERETSLSQKLSKTSKRAHSLRQDNDIHPAILSLGLKFGDWLIGRPHQPCPCESQLPCWHRRHAHRRAVLVELHVSRCKRKARSETTASPGT